jgi:BirA family biotin operon repressor/biotin-[acetyl-CoA-carboxylase] ligase
MSVCLNKEFICAGLQTGLIGRKIRIFQEIDSTNLEAIRQAQKGAPEGLVILADSQSQGRGRSGRNWYSPPGLNIYCSVILRPHFLPSEAPRISFLAAVAAAWSCQKTFNFSPLIKWPNDLLYEGKKFAGILSEMKAVASSIRYVVLGIGINVNITHELLPPELADSSTSIREVMGHPVSREELTKSLLKELDYWYGVLLKEGFHPIREEWNRMSALNGWIIQVRDGDTILAGKALALQEDGTLILHALDGTIHQLVAGDIVMEERV